MDIIEQLRRDEGERLAMYLDSEGVPTIGVGHNLRNKPITKRASATILDDDVQDATSALITALPWTLHLDDARIGVLKNMTFNLGINGLLEFKQTLSLIEAGSYEAAGDEMLKSTWAQQVGPRAHRLSIQMKTGEWV